MFLFWLIVWGLHYLFYQERLLPENYLWISCLIPVAATVELLFRDRRHKSLCGLSRGQIWNVSQREILFLLVTIFGVLVMNRDEQLSRLFLAIFLLVYSCWIMWMNQVGHRMIQRRLYRRSKSSSANTVILAPPSEIEKGDTLSMQSNLPGADFLGYVSYGPTGAAVLPSYPVLGEFQNIAEICRHCKARMLLILGLDDHPDLIGSLQQLCDSLGMRLIWISDEKRRFRGNLDTFQSGSQMYLTNWREPLEDPVNRAAKRALDIAISFGVSILVMPPLCLFVWTLHRIFSPGPLFYRQDRTGRDNEVFGMLKFRTMHLNDTPGQQAKAGDARIFPGGNFLRRTSLDEMPQFLNVLNGEMSVVGPRPHFVDHDIEFEGVVDDYRIRQFAKPGLTGLAQVRGYRGETDTDRKVRHRVTLDQFYLRHWSPLIDVCIIIDTAVQVVFPPQSAK